MVGPFEKGGNIEAKRKLAQQAAALVKPHTITGLGSGSTMELFVEALAQRQISENFKNRYVASSKKIAQVAEMHQLQLVDIESVQKIDQAFDGADRISPEGHLIKGGGGSLFRERQVLLMAEEKYIVADASKYVQHFDAQPLPLEIVPFNSEHTKRVLAVLGYEGQFRQQDGQYIVTDNYNYLLDIVLPKQVNLENAYKEIKLLPGVVEVGLFLDDEYILLK